MIPFLNLREINAPYDTEFQERFQLFLEKGWYVLGDEVRLFEEEYAAYCGTKYCIGTANGLDALRLILEGYKILGKLSEGDEVLVASNTYIATILGIQQAGLIPVLVEANIDTYNFDFSNFKNKITAKTKAIMPTHLYGQLTDMEQVYAFAKAYNLLIVTDAAQSHGAASHGKRSGSFGDASGVSFYPTKNLGALGDGGAITTDDEALAEVVKAYRNYGFKERYVSTYQGVNSRLDEVQALFLRIKLRDLDTTNHRRRVIAQRYLDEIKNPKITLPSWDGSENHVFHVFVIRTQERDAFQAYLKENGIGSIIHYPVPPHKQEALQHYAQLSFPVTEQIHQEVLSIPLNPVMSDAMVQEVIQIINAY